jgi:tight adherence protein C
MSPATIVLIAGITAIFCGLLLSLTAVAVFTNEARGVSKSLAVMEAFTTAPDSMRKELEPSFNVRVVAPLLNRFVGIGRRLTPGDYADKIRKRLDVAGNPPGWTPDRVISLKFVGLVLAPGAAIFGCLSLFQKGLMFTLGVGAAAALLGYMAPNLYLHQLGTVRTEKMRKALPDALDLLTISVEAGLGFDSAIQQVARNTEGPLASEFARVLQEMQIGMGRSQALRALGDRSTLSDLRAFASAMVQADAFGIPIGKVLRVQSSEIRIKRRQAAEEKAQKVAVKIMVPLVLCILPGLFIAVLGPAAISIMAMFSTM